MAEVKAKVEEFADLIGVIIGAIMGYTGGFLGLVAGAAGGYFIAREFKKRGGGSSSPQPKYKQV